MAVHSEGLVWQQQHSHTSYGRATAATATVD